MPDISKLSGERKAAILVVLLGEEVSGGLFEHMSKREVAKIAREVAELGPVEPEIGQRILEEYYLEAIQEPKVQGGPEMARRILSKASISEEIVDQLVKEPVHSDDALGPLLEAPPDVLAEALGDEHPQTTALVLLHLPPQRAAKLLSALPEDKRGETVLRMAEVKAVRDEILDDVAASLHERLGQAGKSKGDEGGILRTAEVLGAMPRNESKLLLEELEPDHPDHVQELRDNLYTFDSLIGVDDRGIQELLRAVDSSKIALALDGAEENLMDKFLGNLSERAAGRLREEMELNDKASKAEKEEAAKEILALALQLEADGKLVFQEPEEPSDGE